MVINDGTLTVKLGEDGEVDGFRETLKYEKI